MKKQTENFCVLTEPSQRMFLRRRESPEQILCIQSLKACLGELAATLGGVNPHPCQLIKLLNGQNDWLTVPVGRQQIARVILIALAFDIDAVPPVTRAGGQEQV